MKVFFIVVALSVASTLLGQQGTFVPHWKVGDKLTFTRLNRDYTWLDGKLTSYLEENQVSHIEVLTATNDGFTIKVTYPNAAARLTGLYYPSISKRIKTVRPMEVVYFIDKSGTAIDVLNAKELIKELVPIFDDIEQASDKLKQHKSRFKMQMGILQAEMDSSIYILSYFSPDLDMLLFPFNKDLIMNDTLRSDGFISFDCKGNRIPTINGFVLKQDTTGNANSLVIEYLQEYDFEHAEGALMDTTRGTLTMESTGLPSTERRVYFNASTGWVSAVHTKYHSEFTNNGHLQKNLREHIIRIE